MVNYTIKNFHSPPKTTAEDRKKRIDKDYDEYVESYRGLYEDNPSFYASPEAFRKHMPLTKENFVWINGGEGAWGSVYTEEELEAMQERYERMGDIDGRPLNEQLRDRGTVEDSPDGGKVFVWNKRGEAKTTTAMKDKMNSFYPDDADE